MNMINSTDMLCMENVRLDNRMQFVRQRSLRKKVCLHCHRLQKGLFASMTTPFRRKWSSIVWKKEG